MYGERIFWAPGCGKSLNLTTTASTLLIPVPTACRVVGISAIVTTVVEASSAAPVITASVVDADGSSDPVAVCTLTIPNATEVGTLKRTRVPNGSEVLCDPVAGQNLATPNTAKNRQILLAVTTQCAGGSTTGIANVVVLLEPCAESNLIGSV